jgi:pSer/pThr/pTyr-binding forkhead associated (FHA) protein
VVPIDGVSRRHCQLSVDEGVKLLDLGSTNGTWLNGREIETGVEHELHSGDRIELTGVAFKFLEGNDLESLYHEELYQLAIVDGLTRIFNRRYLMDFLTREISR